MTRDAPSAVSAAVRRFPASGAQISTLAAKDDAFRDMCEELAEADALLARLDASRPANETERRLECEGWIERLTAEIADALRKAQVVPLPTRGAR